MFKGVTRLGDADVPHTNCGGDVPLRTAKYTGVFINGRPVSVQGDHNTPHPGIPCGNHCCNHSEPIILGCPTVKVNGMGIGRVGDDVGGATACTSVATGSGNVFAGILTGS